jgi:hypothetical protein
MGGVLWCVWQDVQIDPEIRRHTPQDSCGKRHPEPVETRNCSRKSMREPLLFEFMLRTT